MERILAIQIKRIGDLILTAPALSRLRRAKPEAEIVLVTMGAAGQLVPAIPAVDRHFSYRYGRPNALLWSSLINDSYDAVLDFNGADRSLFMAWLTGADLRATYEKRAKGWLREQVYTHTSNAKLRPYHTVDHMAALLDVLDIPAPEAGVESEPLSLAIPEDVQTAVDARLAALGLDSAAGFAVVHPGTARPEKYWQADRWADVIRSLADQRLPCVITGGKDPEEKQHLDQILSSLPEDQRPMVVAGELSLLETAAVIRRATLALGVDTAAMHLASAFRIPQVVLFGPTNPFHWRPRHAGARIVLAGHEGIMSESDYEDRIEEHPMDDIPVSQMMEAIASLDLEPAGN